MYDVVMCRVKVHARSQKSRQGIAGWSPEVWGSAAECGKVSRDVGWGCSTSYLKLLACFETLFGSHFSMIHMSEVCSLWFCHLLHVHVLTNAAH